MKYQELTLVAQGAPFGVAALQPGTGGDAHRMLNPKCPRRLWLSIILPWLEKITQCSA